MTDIRRDQRHASSPATQRDIPLTIVECLVNLIFQVFRLVLKLALGLLSLALELLGLALSLKVRIISPLANLLLDFASDLFRCSRDFLFSTHRLYPFTFLRHDTFVRRSVHACRNKPVPHTRGTERLDW